MSNTARRITNAAAQQAVESMIAEMSPWWDGFKCDGRIVRDSQYGAWVKIEIPAEDEPEAWYQAIIFHKNGEYICMPDFYIGEGTSVRGTKGGEYIVDEYHTMIEVA